MTIPDSSAVPITILTGCPGAGKAALLDRILGGVHGLRVAVLVDDFGAISIDDEKIVGLNDDVIGLANGCVCCSIRGDLVDTVRRTIDRPEAPECILLEAGSVADPSSIAMAFVAGCLRQRVRLDSVTAVLDADQVFAHLEHPALLEPTIREIGCADLVILNTDNRAGPEQLHRVHQWIDGTFTRRHVIETSHCEVPLEVLLSVGRYGPTRPRLARHRWHPTRLTPHLWHTHHHHRHLHDGAERPTAFSTWSFEASAPLALDAVRAVARTLPSSIYRATGVIYTSDAPGRRIVLQVVGSRVAFSAQGAWDLCVPRSEIVLIGAPASIDTDLMEERFTACISAAP